MPIPRIAVAYTSVNCQSNILQQRHLYTGNLASSRLLMSTTKGCIGYDSLTIKFIDHYRLIYRSTAEKLILRIMSLPSSDKVVR